MRKRLCFLLICISFIGTFFIVKADSTATEVAQDSTFNSSRITGYQEFGEIMLSDPKINAYINYCGERYYYIEHTRTNDDVTNYGITKKGYVATYVIAEPASKTETIVDTTVEKLSSIQVGYSYSFGVSLSSTITAELGVSADAIIAKAKAGISTYFNSNFGTGTATSIDITYSLSDLFREEMKNTDCLSVTYTKTKYTFISLVYKPYVYKTGSLWWEKIHSGHDVYAYITTAVGVTSYKLIKN